MTKFEKRDEASVVRLQSDGFDTSLSKYGVRIGDTAKIQGFIRYEDGPQYEVDIYRDGELIEEELSVGEEEIEYVCEENHKLLYHDRREEYFCPFCSHSEEVLE